MERHVTHLVPKLCLGTQLWETLFPVRQVGSCPRNSVSRTGVPKQSLGTRRGAAGATVNKDGPYKSHKRLKQSVLPLNYRPSQIGRGGIEPPTSRLWTGNVCTLLRSDTGTVSTVSVSVGAVTRPCASLGIGKRGPHKFQKLFTLPHGVWAKGGSAGIEPAFRLTAGRHQFVCSCGWVRAFQSDLQTQ